MDLSCHCGQIRIAVDARPDHVYECNCTLCSKTGARWGYFHPDQVRVSGDAAAYRRVDKEAPSADVHFCPACGVTTHFSLTESAIARFGNTMMGVNVWLADRADLAGIELRFPDGRNWAGEGDFSFVRPPVVIGVH